VRLRITARQVRTPYHSKRQALHVTGHTPRMELIEAIGAQAQQVRLGGDVRTSSAIGADPNGGHALTACFAAASATNSRSIRSAVGLICSA
jgi:hypothetical protein